MNASEKRTNRELLDAVLWDLTQRHQAAVELIALLEQAEPLRKQVTATAAASFVTSVTGDTGQLRLYMLLSHTQNKARHLAHVIDGSTCYHENIAAFMTDDEAAQLIAAHKAATH